MIQLKAGVSLRGIRAELVLGLIVAEQAFGALGVPLVVTSLTEAAPGRSPDSFHPKGLAADLRLHHVHQRDREKLIQRLATLLGQEWDVLWRARGTPQEHIHLEYDRPPKDTRPGPEEWP